jgi:hypothetical protein
VSGITATTVATSSASAADIDAGLGVVDGTIKNGAIAYTGRVSVLSDAPSRADSRIDSINVPGLGYLTADLSAIAPEVTLGEFTGWFKLPDGFDESGDTDATFRALATYSVTEAPLVAVRATAIAPVAQDARLGVDAMINRTPITSAVHKIYVVPVTPNGTSASAATASQSEANIRSDVAQSDAYWSAQSNGKIHFEVAGITSWYNSSISCDASVDANADALWNQAANVAFAQLGYRDSANSVLLLVFPAGTDCGPAAGLTRAAEPSVNSGSLVWVVGTVTVPYDIGVLKHELGHAMSFSHASWADCATPSPSPGQSGSSGCDFVEYGDLSDVMGGGAHLSVGAISSPNAIRSSIWDSSAYAVAPPGTSSSYVLNSVSSHSGLRSVIVEDSQGYDYFVEFRNQTNEDAPLASEACNAPRYCNSTVPGVRVLRLKYNSYYKGISTQNSILIGRTVAGVRKTTYVGGESFTTNGMTITVSGITATTASVSIVRPSMSLTTDSVWINRTVNGSDTYNSQPRIGDTWTAMVGSWWNADSFSFQWYRSGKAISGATKQSYTITGSDKGKTLKVKVTGKLGSKTSYRTDPSAYYSGYIIYPGEMLAGSVSIDYSATPFVAKPKAWTVPGVTLKYQWYRNGSAVSGQTGSTYTATTADRDKTLTVKVSASKSGYNSLSATSAATPDLTIDSTGVAVISGTPQVGKTLSVNNLSYTLPGGGSIASPVRGYQWYRSGSKITGAVNQTYVLTSSDYGKKMTVAVSGGLAGYIPHTTTSAATTTVARGVFNGSLAAPVVTETDLPTRRLTVTMPVGSITDASPSYSYQWYRGTSKISKATKSYYKLTSSDYGKNVTVRVKVAKSNYTSIYLYSADASYSLIPSSTTPTITGTLAIGQTISVAPVTTTLNGSPVTPDFTYRWYRNTSTISGATSSSYTLTPSDIGKTIKVTVTSSKLGALGWSKTSASTAKLGSSTVPMAGWNAQANATVSLPDASRVLTVTGTGITEPDVKYSFQWYRGSSKISKATKSYYKLSSSDTGKLISVRVLASKSTFTSITKSSVPVNYTVTANSAPVISDTTPAVNDTLTITLPTYTLAGSPFVPSSGDYTYRWYRSGSSISGATGDTYVVKSSDKGKTIKVKVTVTAPNYLGSSSTSSSTSKVIS